MRRALSATICPINPFGVTGDPSLGRDLIGRETELAQLEALLSAARSGTSGALVVRGEAGIGKTALLEWAVQSATGMRVLRARGIESESGVPFAALFELVKPVEDALDMLPEQSADALRGALALGPPVAVPPLRIGVAVLGLLATVAEELPLLVVVDDAHWVDGASATAMLFAARRLGADSVAIMFAVRDGEPHVPDTSGLDELVLDGLDRQSARRLVEVAAREDVSEGVCSQLYEAVRGNPLALIEGIRLLGPKQRSGHVQLPILLRPGPRIERGFSRRIARLSAPARRTLVVAAAAEGSGTAEISAALRELGLSLDFLGEAETEGIVVLHEERFEFSHPLLRAVAYHSAPVAERRAAHLALARSLADGAPTRSVLHRAAAATDPDEDVAAALESVARRAAARGAPSEAARALARAATLSPKRVDRAERLLEAIQLAALAGDFGHARELANRGMSEAPDTSTRPAFELQHGVVELAVGSPRAAHDELVEAASRAQPRDPDIAAMMLAVAAVSSVMAAECRRALEESERALSLPLEAGGIAKLAATATRAMARILLGAGAGEAATLLRVHAELTAIAAEGTPLPVPLFMALTLQLVWMERFEDASRIVRGTIAAARAAAAPMSLPYDLAVLAELELRAGDLIAAYASAAESVQLARDTRQASYLTYSLATLARVEAYQARVEDCRSHAADAIALAAPLGVGSVPTYAYAAVGLLELGLGHPEAAIRVLITVGEMAIAHGVEEPNVVQWQPDLVEAYVRCGRRQDALAELELLERRARNTGGTWAAAAALRCRGLLAPEDAFDAVFADALALHSTQELTIERARTELCLGGRLRRAGRHREAREPLRRALDKLDRTGARAWAGLAHAELLAAGERQPRHSASIELKLTAQELQVTRAVAAGATNAEASSQLFISTKTVEKHLTSAYRKLGVRSRAELAARYAAREGDK